MNRTEPNAILLGHVLGEAHPPRSVEQRIVQGALARLDVPASRTPWRVIAAGTAVVASALAGVLWVASVPSPEVASAAHAMTATAGAPLVNIAAGALHPASAAAASYRIGEHQIRAGAATELRFVETAPNAVALQLDHGNIRCAVEPLPAGALFSVQTPRLRVEVVGTLFEVDSDERRSRVHVTEGRVRVSGDAGVRMLGAGEDAVQCDVQPDDEPRAETPAALTPVGQGPVTATVPVAPAPTGAAILRGGLAELTAGDFGAAAVAFAHYLAAYPRGDLEEEALFYLAFTEQRLGHQVAAKRVTSRFVERFPDSRRAQSLRGMILAEEK